MKIERTISISFKSLGKNILNSFLMMIGVIVGILALTLIISAALGSQKQVMEGVKKFGYDTIMLFPGSGGRKIREANGEVVQPLIPEDVDFIKSRMGEYFTGICPYSARPEMDFKYEGKLFTGKLFGTNTDFSVVWQWDVKSGDFFTEDDLAYQSRVCVVGMDVVKELFGDTDPLGEKITVKNQQFEIVGVLESKGSTPGGGPIDDRVFIPITTFLKRLYNINELDNIRLIVRNVKKYAETVKLLKEAMRERRNIASGQPDDFTIKTPEEVTAQIEKVSGTFNILLVFIAAISLITGGVVIANIMLISVDKRKTEIGLRKSIGANNRDILLQFLFEAMAVTLTGGFIGIGLGIIGVYVMLMITKIPVVISWESILIGFGLSLVIGIISGIQPARKAARLEPIEVLRS